MDDFAPAPQADATPVVSAPAVEDNSPQPSPVAEPTTSVEAAPVGAAEPAQVTEPAATAPTTDTEHQPSRLERRIDQLESKSAGINNVLNNLRQYREQASAPVPEVPLPRLSELVQGKESLDPAELDQMGQQVAQAQRVNTDLRYQQLEQRMAINEAITEAEKDAAVAFNTYDELKDTSPAYSKSLEQRIEARYQREAFVPNPLNPMQKILNPNIKLADIAREEVDAFRQAVELGKAQTSAALAVQADQSAVTPTSDSPVEKSVEDMSLEEHEAYLRNKGYHV